MKLKVTHLALFFSLSSCQETVVEAFNKAPISQNEPVSPISEDDTSGDSSPTPPNESHPEIRISYQEIREKILSHYCLRCHAREVSPQALSSEEDLLAYINLENPEESLLYTIVSPPEEGLRAEMPREEPSSSQKNANFC